MMPWRIGLFCLPALFSSVLALFLGAPFSRAGWAPAASGLRLTSTATEGKESVSF